MSDVEQRVRRNPYDFTREVTDPELFAGRKQELATITEYVADMKSDDPAMPPIALVGERRVGKTSLLFRVAEACERAEVLDVLVSLIPTAACDTWEFWRLVFDGITDRLREVGIVDRRLGFTVGNNETTLTESSRMERLRFDEIYPDRGGMRTAPPIQALREDIRSLYNAASETSHKGILVLLDEAHLVLGSHDVQQQIRQVTLGNSGFGLMFAGEPHLAQVFNDSSEPLYSQARILHLENLATVEEILECILLPLSDEEKPLVSPSTVDYISLLSRGKPNQVRLICHSIYRRYERAEQKDICISFETLNDLVDDIETAYGAEYDRQRQLETIRRLSSADLESLYIMTRYANWSMSDVVALDESFRGEVQSHSAAARRQRILEEKRKHFVGLGLMRDEADRCVLAGDEFLQLYLRFLYEVRKYGDLTRRLELGKGPPTPFGEKTDKLARAMTWEVQRKAQITSVTVCQRDAVLENFVAKVKRRYELLEEVLHGDSTPSGEQAEALSECLRICEFVGKPGQYHVLVFCVRDLENPQETRQVELYFGDGGVPLMVPLERVRTLRAQAEECRVLIEEIDWFPVWLPDLRRLLQDLGLPALEELIERLGITEAWWIQSIQHLVQEGANEQKPDEDGKELRGETALPWIEPYERGDADVAEKILTDKLSEASQRSHLAHMYNDRGYVRSASREKRGAAEEDLRRALELHFRHLPLTLLNLGLLDIGNGRYEAAIARVEDALFLTFGREDISAGWLRSRVPSVDLDIARREEWEHHPANVLETGYVNLAYASLHHLGPERALEVLSEGLKLLPSSALIKHALARLYLYRHQVDLADQMYQELSMATLRDANLAREINHYVSRMQRRRRRGRSSKGRKR